MVHKQGGIPVVPHLLWHGASVFAVSFEGPSHFVALYDKPGRRLKISLQIKIKSWQHKIIFRQIESFNQHTITFDSSKTSLTVSTSPYMLLISHYQIFQNDNCKIDNFWKNGLKLSVNTCNYEHPLFPHDNHSHSESYKGINKRTRAHLHLFIHMCIKI